MQKFKKGTLVRIAKNLGPSMNHFRGGCLAVVESTYDEEYGGGDTKSYSLYLEDGNSVSWYKEDQLTLVDSGGGEALKTEWEEKQQQEDALNSEWKRIYDESPDQLPPDVIKHLWEEVMGLGSLSEDKMEDFGNMDIVNNSYKFCKNNHLKSAYLPASIRVSLATNKNLNI